MVASRVHLHFHTDQSSQTHRGFLIHYAGLLSVLILHSLIGMLICLRRKLISEIRIAVDCRIAVDIKFAIHIHVHIHISCVHIATKFSRNTAVTERPFPQAFL